MEQQVTNNEVEVVKAEAAPVAEEQIQPEIEAVKFLITALPSFRTKLDKLTGVQAKRVLSALMEAPLEKETPNFTTREAEDLFMLGLMISNAKFVLFSVAIKDHELTKNIEQESKDAAIADQQTKEEENEKQN